MQESLLDGQAESTERFVVVKQPFFKTICRLIGETFNANTPRIGLALLADLITRCKDKRVLERLAHA